MEIDNPFTSRILYVGILNVPFGGSEVDSDIVRSVFVRLVVKDEVVLVVVLRSMVHPDMLT